MMSRILMFAAAGRSVLFLEKTGTAFQCGMAAGMKI